MFRTIIIGRRLFSTAELRAPRIGLISGSSRDGSLNTKLVAAAGIVAKGQGAEVETIAIDKLPMYSQDVEEAGFPEAATLLKEKLANVDGIIVAGPEYNGFATPLFVNSVSWASRGDPNGHMYASFKGKVASVISTSPGPMGGMRSHNMYARLLQNVGVNCLPTSVAVGGAFKAFKEDGTLADAKLAGMLETAVAHLVETAKVIANREVGCKILDALKNGETVGEYGTVTTAT